MRRPRILISAVALDVLHLIFSLLGRMQAGGPPHSDLELAGGVPATLYVPGTSEGRHFLPDPAPRGERPPGVVLAHGFASDRAGVSVLARSLAAAGYSVLSIEFRGHGANRNAFAAGRGRDDFLFQDLAAAVEYLRGSPYADGSRIALMGHSMGAGAVLEYGSRDPGIDGLVLISGGWRMTGPYPPPNTLFLYAEGDPERIRARTLAVGERLADRRGLENGRVYGEFQRGSAVSRVEVPGADHASIVTNSRAVGEIVGWLDRIFEVERSSPARREDPRLGLAMLGYLVFALVLPGLGALIGRLAPVPARAAQRGRPLDLGLLALVLVATLPLFAVGRLGAFLPLEVADVIVPHLALAGLCLLIALQLTGRFDPASLLRGARGALAASVIGLVAIYALLAPLGIVIHRLTLTPERAAVGLLSMLLLLPFTYVFNEVLRRGNLLEASGLCLAGRFLVVGILWLGVATGVTSGVVLLMLPMLAFLFVLFELLSASIYATTRSIATIALIEAGWLAWIFAAVLPIRI